MDRHWSMQELAEHWSLGFEDLARLESKAEALRIGFAAQLKFYQLAGRFPSSAAEVPDAARDYLAVQLDQHVTELFDYDWSGRNGQRHRLEILNFLGIRAVEAHDFEALKDWLAMEVCPSGMTQETALKSIDRWSLRRKVRPPSASVLQRLVRTARRRFEEALLNQITATLSPEATTHLEASLNHPDTLTGYGS